MKNNNGNNTLKKYDEIFFDEKQIFDIEIEKLVEFKDHPFLVQNDEKMQELIESIKSQGVLTPIIVRKKFAKFEIISGHRRVYACKELGITKIPAVRLELSDDEASIIMVDSNIQREEIKTSEKARAYKIRYDAIKHQGVYMPLIPRKSTSCQFGTKLRSDEIVANETGDSARQIHRYIKLNQLINELIDLVDLKKLPFNSALELTVLNKDEQEAVASLIDSDSIRLTMAQSKKIRKMSENGKFSEEELLNIVCREKKHEKKIIIDGSEIRDYFPKSWTPKRISEKIIEIIKNWEMEEMKNEK